MDSFPAQRLFGVFGKLAACVAGLSLALSAPAFADLLDQRTELINKYVTEMHADPLVADCAAHGNFIASTSSAFDHVEFPPSAFDSSNATITPWNDSFDEGKQRIKVDSIVTVEGLGISQNGGDPASLKFRCGYVGSQMLAFSWNDPVPPARPRAERSSSSKRQLHGGHRGKGKAKASGKSTRKSATVKKSTTSKKTVKKKSTAKKS
ncbi:BspC domain-containing protein [Burkholderia gladioli]|uniref:BspC domain-containing protein n=1 Tax=Burkholderia gladioli TaxID=28095 RepID=UPI003D2380DD